MRGNNKFGSNVILGASGTTAADVTLDAYDATVTVQGIGANGTTDNDEINAISITGATINLDGVYNSTGNASDDKSSITFTGAVKLAGDTTVDSDSASHDGDIQFSSTIDDDNVGRSRCGVEGCTTNSANWNKGPDTF